MYWGVKRQFKSTSTFDDLIIELRIGSDFMRDIFLLCSTLTIFVLVYIIIDRAGILFNDIFCLNESENENNRYLIRIATENPMLIGSISSAMEKCSGMYPHMEFSIVSGRAKRLFRDLENGTIDIVLLSEDSIIQQPIPFGHMMIPYTPGVVTEIGIGLSIENLDTDHSVYVYWNKQNDSDAGKKIVCYNLVRFLGGGTSGTIEKRSFKDIL